MDPAGKILTKKPGHSLKTMPGHYRIQTSRIALTVIHESCNLRQARPFYSQYVDLPRTPIRLLLPHWNI